MKNMPSDAGDTGDVSSFPGWGRPPGGGNGNHCSILAWEIPWTEEPGGLQSTGWRRVGHDRLTEPARHFWAGMSSVDLKSSCFCFKQLSLSFLAFRMGMLVSMFFKFL